MGLSNAERHDAMSGVSAERLQRPQAAPAMGRENRRFRVLLGLMVWLQIAYMTIYIEPPPPKPTTLVPSAEARLLKVVLLVLGAAVILSRMAVVRQVLKHMDRFFLLFVALATLSVLWSIDPQVTATRLIALVSMLAVCLAFGVGAWHPRRFQSVIRPALTLFLIVSLIVGMIHPDLVMEHGNTLSLRDAWRGLTAQKNVFGELASFCALFWFHAWLARDVRAPRALAGLAVAITCLWLSRSSTSMFCTVFAMAFLFLVTRFGPGAPRYMRYVVALFAGVAVIYCLAVMNVLPGVERVILEPVMKITGKGLTFSGRTLIWQIVRENIARHPYLGSGYAAYWGAGPIPTSPSYVFRQRMWGFWPSEAHNGYLEIMNDLGDVGLACLVGYILTYLSQCIRLFRFDRMQAALFLALLLQQAILNLSESTWLDLDNICFIFMTVATVMIARALSEHSRASPRPRQELQTMRRPP